MTIFLWVALCFCCLLIGLLSAALTAEREKLKGVEDQLQHAKETIEEMLEVEEQCDTDVAEEERRRWEMN